MKATNWLRESIRSSRNNKIYHEGKIEVTTEGLRLKVNRFDYLEIFLTDEEIEKLENDIKKMKLLKNKSISEIMKEKNIK